MVTQPVAHHKSTWTCYKPESPMWLSIEAQGSLFKLKHTERFAVWYERPAPPTGKRGEITGFSRDSRRRLLETFARLDRRRLRPQQLKFITLTYQRNQQNPAEAKRDLDVFVKRLRRIYPELWLVWRMEWQERGAIHFHLMASMPFTPVQRLQTAWNEVIGEDAPNSLDLEPLRSFRGVMSYAAKYMGKPTGDGASGGDGSMGLSMPHISPPTWTGRHWGVYGRKHIPFAKRVTARFVMTLRSLTDYAKKHSNPWVNPFHSFTSYGDALAEVKRIYTAFHSDPDNAVWTVIYRERNAWTRTKWVSSFYE